jgi:hypothetical protein
MTFFGFDVNRMSRHVGPSCGMNIGPIVFISVRDDHAREREYADPLFCPIPARELEGGLPKARMKSDGHYLLRRCESCRDTSHTCSNKW